ncbi:MAG: hypothetical protein HRU41_21350 [Saprospiraceae bacterium]|nr:hypothetical protein [Saprospiraceae bacterium]
MKILIFGPPGAGKSKLAFDLGKKMELPVFHVDHYFFKGPDIHVPVKEAMKELKTALPDDNWVIEGNHGAVLSFLTMRADHTIVLQVSPLICLFRVYKRYLQQDPQLKRAISEGWEEKMSWQFTWFILRLFPKNFAKQKRQIQEIAIGKVHLVRNAKRFDLHLLQ